MTSTHIQIPKGLPIRDEYLTLVQTYFDDQIPFRGRPFCLTLKPEEEKLVDALLENRHLKSPRILVSVGSRWKNKQVSIDTMVSFLQKIESNLKNVSFWFTSGSPEEKMEATKVKEKLQSNAILVEELPLPLLQNLMDRMDFVVAMDSLPLHLAATTSVRILGIFGPSSAKKYGLNRPGYQTIQGACPFGCRFEKRCKKLRTCKSGGCMDSIKADELYQAFNRGFYEGI